MREADSDFHSMSPGTVLIRFQRCFGVWPMGFLQRADRGGLAAASAGQRPAVATYFPSP
jgi:hypothetical protein